VNTQGTYTELLRVCFRCLDPVYLRSMCVQCARNNVTLWCHHMELGELETSWRQSLRHC